MERLTEKGNSLCTDCDLIKGCGGECLESKIYNRLAELEDELESGELIKLPCKIGDTVYAILEVNDGYEIFDYTVREIIINENGFYFETPTGYSHKLKFGKSVFTDKQQAEARLKELQER